MSKMIELAKKLEELEKQRDAIRDELELVMTEMPLGTMEQDPETLAVYKTYKPTGTFISFRQIDYKRTNMEGESSGGPSVLSKKEAEGAGFTIKR